MVGLGWGFVTAVSATAQGPVETVKNFSDFAQIDLSQLPGGDVLVARDALMNFPNGISGQTCFAVPQPAEDTAKRLQTWDPSLHSDLKVYAFRPLHVPCELTDFQQLDFGSGQYPVRWLLDKTLASSAAKSELNLTRDEVNELAACVQKRRDPQAVGRCWANLLFARASKFQQQGSVGVLPYQMNGETVSPAVQLHAILLEQARVAGEFAPFLKKIGLLGNEAATTSLAPFYYWTFFDADHHGTLSLGAVYLLAVGDHYQLADFEYYVSGNYYTSLTLYEVWPIQVGGKPGALVWRGDYFAAPTLAFTKGTERIAYGALMMQDIKREIRCFRDDLKARR